MYVRSSWSLGVFAWVYVCCVCAFMCYVYIHMNVCNMYEYACNTRADIPVIRRIRQCRLSLVVIVSLLVCFNENIGVFAKHKSFGVFV